MYEALLAALAAEELRGAVGEHLVHVHVALRTRARLPNRKRQELLVVAPGERFVGRTLDRVGLFGIEQA